MGPGAVGRRRVRGGDRRKTHRIAEVMSEDIQSARRREICE